MRDTFGVEREIVVDFVSWGGVWTGGPDASPEVFDYFGLCFGVGGGFISDFGSEVGERGFGGGKCGTYFVSYLCRCCFGSEDGRAVRLVVVIPVV